MAGFTTACRSPTRIQPQIDLICQLPENDTNRAQAAMIDEAETIRTIEQTRQQSMQGLPANE